MAAFVGGLGTGGTLMGNARRLKEENPDTLIVAAEPLPGRAGAGPAVAGGRLHPADHRPLAARPEDLRVQPRQRGLDQAAAQGGGPVRWASRAARSPRSPCAWPRSSTRATWSSSRPTTAGSTSARASTPSRSRSSSRVTLDIGLILVGAAPNELLLLGRRGRLILFREASLRHAASACRGSFRSRRGRPASGSSGPRPRARPAPRS